MSVNEDLLCSFQILQGKGAVKMNQAGPSTTSTPPGGGEAKAMEAEADSKKRRT